MDQCSMESFRKVYQYEKQSKQWRLSSLVSCNPKEVLFRFLPITKWLPQYKFREDLAFDVMIGITLGVIQIPQGLVNALLANVPPIVGLYSAVFPVLVYVVMGTSKHMSTGGFAILSIMVGNMVSTYAEPNGPYSSVEVVTAISFMIGLWQTILGLLQLGALSVIFSETLVSGFSTGVSIHIITSQVPSLLGIKIKSFHGFLNLVYIYREVFLHIQEFNWIALTMSVVFITVLISFQRIIRPVIQKRFSYPIPFEIIVIIVGTTLSYFLDLKELGVSIVGDLPRGLPVPTFPNVSIFSLIAVESLICAVIATAINVSLTKYYARRFLYEVDDNQELLAHGFSNIVGSLFSSYPTASSFSRSAIIVDAGCRSLLCVAVSCCILIFVILFAGSLFSALPHCVLACIVVCALMNVFLQIKTFPGIYRTSKVDGFIWMSTFLAVIFLDIDFGLGVGVFVVLTSSLIKSQVPSIETVGCVPNTQIYLDLNSFGSALEIPNVKILRIYGCFSFVNCDTIRDLVLSLFQTKSYQYVILDFTAVSYIDPGAVKTLLSLQTGLKSRQCILLLCECNDRVYNTLTHCKFFDSFPNERVFLFLHDAVSSTFGKESDMKTQL